MTWNNIKFTANEVIRICIQVVLGAVFIMMMKSDIKMIADGLAEMKQEGKEERERDRTWKAKMEAEYSEIKVRLAILEQKVTNMEILPK
ncbi:hypothetical protein ACQKLP_21905 [Chitinophaga sp. NPDC101104]|uniref:hypothetical protein n=1 Tax=Chitinophaga sp. NPDC101104 TaxID=3390561 RepID=UPI003D07B370